MERSLRTGEEASWTDASRERDLSGYIPEEQQQRTRLEEGLSYRAIHADRVMHRENYIARAGDDMRGAAASRHLYI